MRAYSATVLLLMAAAMVPSLLRLSGPPAAIEGALLWALIIVAFCGACCCVLGWLRLLVVVDLLLIGFVALPPQVFLARTGPVIGWFVIGLFTLHLAWLAIQLQRTRSRDAPRALATPRHPDLPDHD